MGVVYKAEDTKLKRTVALKFLPPELTRNKDAKTRFIHEAQAASALQHNNICSIHEIDETPDGQLFICMDCYQGKTLDKIIAGGPLPFDEAVDIVSQIATGLSEAHEAGMVHRVIKPANVMITDKGVVKILDFGLAKLSGQTKVTKTGTTVGTVAYMSPEQASGEELDTRSDIWSLGVVFYELITGGSPFKGDHEAAVIYSIMQGDPQPVTGLRSEIPIEVDRVIERILAKDRVERYQTAPDLLVDLRRLRQGVSVGLTHGRKGAQRGGSRMANRRWLWGVPVVALLTILVVAKFLSPTDELPSGDERAAPSRPNWILVSDFIGPKDDPDLAIGVRELVVSSLTQSGIVTPLSRSDLKHGLELAMKPDTTRIEGEVARELAYRAAARVYIEGRIDRIMSGYSIVLHVNDTETGSFVYSVQGTAETGDDVIVTLDRITRELREKLGEDPGKIAATRRAGDAMTHSFTAFQKWVRAVELHNDSRFPESRELLRDALRLDPDFASAWVTLAVGFGNSGLIDSARYAYEQALRRRDRQTEETYLYTKAMVTGFMDYKLTEALDHWDRLIRITSKPRYYVSRGVVLTVLGREEEALQSHMKAIELMPFGPGNITYLNAADCLITLGRYDDAKRIIPKIPNPESQERREIYVACALSDWARVDSIISHGLLGRQSPIEREMVMASLEASRGSLRAAARRAAGDRTITFSEDIFHFCVWKVQVITTTGMDELLSTVTVCKDTTMAGYIVETIRSASAGDIRTAENLLDAIRLKPEHLQRRYKTDITVVEAWINAANGEWEKVVRELESLAQGGEYSQFTNRLPVRWLIAEAYEKQGLLEQAAEAFELVISPVLTSTRDLFFRASYVSLAHYRLALIYSQLGRLQEARQNWLAFEAMFTNPDAELTPMLQEARSAVAKLEQGL